jgi:hypothetical protein
MLFRFFFFLAVCSGSWAGATGLNPEPAPPPMDFSRYQGILNRMPFGAEPSPEAIAAAAAANLPPAESFTQNLQFCGLTLNKRTKAVQVGLYETVVKKSYLLAEGEQEDGIRVVKADFANERALLRKGAEEVWMGMNQVQAVAVPVRAMPAPAAARAPARPAIPAPGAVLHPERLKPALTGEALKKHLEQYQMDLIRAGGSKGPPLPMELTPEMDQQLVSEGVLPPAE